MKVKIKFAFHESKYFWKLFACADIYKSRTTTSKQSKLQFFKHAEVLITIVHWEIKILKYAFVVK